MKTTSCSQGSLFSELPLLEAPRASVAWRAFPTFCGRHYQMLADDQPNGAWVRHWGHPTALRPYYVEATAETFLPLKCGLLKDAKAAAIAAVMGARPDLSFETRQR